MDLEFRVKHDSIVIILYFSIFKNDKTITRMKFEANSKLLTYSAIKLILDVC